MNIDFHTHVKISKRSSFNPEYFEEMMTEARASGLDAIALTEHFNTNCFMDVYDYLDAHCSYEHGYYEANGLKVFPGIEIDVKEVGHILFIGAREDIISIRQLLDYHTEKEHFIPFSKLLDIGETYEVLKIGAHPFRESTPLHQLPIEQLRRLDAFDLNGKDLYSYEQASYQEQLISFAEKVGLPIVGGSDTHQFLQYGSIMNELSFDCRTVAELKACIFSNDYHIHIADDLPLKVRSATLVKKYMKKYISEKNRATSFIS
ncbi:PHP domain-containing protein [Ornithinibacillus gellani]|uniref:PHP domain-containing protein n=1 Tax=Ornithinibacillus gellani TaxID=2293253 RepID=UPI000F48C95F|nr:PHP domain-containing protein [Ornithinibacillus gellani]TQS71885.1 PHP domain-containing protein [Ornithinibacillus gellani]